MLYKLLPLALLLVPGLARPEPKVSGQALRAVRFGDAPAPEIVKAVPRQENEADGVEKPPRLANATSSDIDRARAIVEEAIKKATEVNKARKATPPLHKNAKVGPQRRQAENGTAAPVLDITAEIRAAAALVAEANAYEEAKNSTEPPVAKRQSSSWWMANISRSGSWPWGSNAAGFKVYRNVKDYGAKGDGVTDDTQAIMNAVKDFSACGPGCYSSTTKGAIIYFPAGTYLVSSTIETYYGTQFIGDATNRPTIKAAASFVGLGVLSTDHYVDGGGLGVDGNAKEWFINTSVFYRQIRNFIIDISNTDQGAYIAALHYQVGQATSLQFVDVICTTSATTTQQGIWIENGSGGFMADLTFTGGAFGIYGGNQQFTSQRITFTNVRTAVQLTWNWGWAWKSIQIVNCGIGFKLMSEDNVKNTGSLMVSDSIFKSTTTAIMTFPFSNVTRDTTTGITLDNVKFDGVTNGVWDGSKSYLAGSTASVDTWVQGRVYSGNTDNAVVPGSYSNPRDSVMVGANPNGLPKAPYFEKAKPQYETVAASSFIHMKSSCKGDGVTDDTSCFQAVLNSASTSSVVFVDAGTYMISNTITVPKNIRIVGEVWSQIAAYGSNFGNSKAPKPLFQVGQPGDVGNVEIQDLLFTSKGNTPGLVFVEWNVRAASAGSAGMWDCHVRVGGASGTDLESKNCPALTSGTNSNCNGGSAMMHITSQASGYFENSWLWVADHDLDDPDWNNDNNFMTQCSVYVGRGLLVESVNPVWLYGTASEHSVMYQYQFNNAAHVYATMIQTETPYYQPNPKPPAPVSDSVGVFNGDPDYTCSGSNTLGCDAAWALRILGSNSITIHGAGLYSWFSTYSQDCVDNTNCQSNLIQFKDNTGSVRVHNLVTIGSVNMIQDNNSKQIAALDNLAVNFSPYMANIAVYDAHKL